MLLITYVSLSISDPCSTKGARCCLFTSTIYIVTDTDSLREVINHQKKQENLHKTKVSRHLSTRRIWQQNIQFILPSDLLIHRCQGETLKPKHLSLIKSVIAQVEELIDCFVGCSFPRINRFTNHRRGIIAIPPTLSVATK